MGILTFIFIFQSPGSLICKHENTSCWHICVDPKIISCGRYCCLRFICSVIILIYSFCFYCTHQTYTRRRRSAHLAGVGGRTSYVSHGDWRRAAVSPSNRTAQAPLQSRWRKGDLKTKTYTGYIMEDVVLQHQHTQHIPRCCIKCPSCGPFQSCCWSLESELKASPCPSLSLSSLLTCLSQKYAARLV